MRLRASFQFDGQTGVVEIATAPAGAFVRIDWPPAVVSRAEAVGCELPFAIVASHASKVLGVIAGRLGSSLQIGGCS